MTHICVKCSTITKSSIDKTTGTWLTTRAIKHVKTCANCIQRQSTTVEKSNVKEDNNKLKLQCIFFSSGQGFFNKLYPR